MDVYLCQNLKKYIKFKYNKFNSYMSILPQKFGENVWKIYDQNVFFDARSSGYIFIFILINKSGAFVRPDCSFLFERLTSI